MKSAAGEAVGAALEVNQEDGLEKVYHAVIVTS